jgi:hypothetical protein
MPRIIPPAVLQFVEGASTDARADVFPFWRSDSEGIPEEGMYLLALELDLPNTAEILADLPVGYRIVFSIFNWEQSRAGEGFSTGIENSGSELVADAANSYEMVGMVEEAAALRRVLQQYVLTPHDFVALDAVYESEPNPYLEDWNRIPHLVRLLCANADSYFYTDAEA